MDRSKWPHLSGLTDGHRDGVAPATTPLSPSSNRRMSPKDAKKLAKSSLRLGGGQKAVRSLGRPHSVGGSRRGSPPSWD